MGTMIIDHKVFIARDARTRHKTRYEESAQNGRAR